MYHGARELRLFLRGPVPGALRMAERWGGASCLTGHVVRLVARGLLVVARCGASCGVPRKRMLRLRFARVDLACRLRSC